jgi:catechol 2,3-dioxygenase-like lactoylglutathione lyase family enzyme
MPMFTHVTVGTNDLAEARAFYDTVLAPLGYKRIKSIVPAPAHNPLQVPLTTRSR